MSRSSLRSLGVVCAFLAGVEGAALAQDTAPTVDQIQIAERSFAAGREAYKNGAFGEAAENFERADANAPNDRVIELAITAREKAGNLDRAATLAQLAIERHPESERLRKLGEPILERAKEEMFAVAIVCDEPCTLLDGTRIVHGAPATQRFVFLTPGTHTIRATWSENRSESKPIEGKANEMQELAFNAPELPQVEDAPAAGTTDDGVGDTGPREPPSGLDPLYFFIGAGLTVATGGVAIWSGIDTLNNPGKARVEEDCANLTVDTCETYKEGKRKELRTNILIAATGVLGVGTAVLGVLFTNWSGEKSAAAPAERKTAKVSPWIGVGDGAMLGAQGRF
jgi:hypothetical protein